MCVVEKIKQTKIILKTSRRTTTMKRKNKLKKEELKRPESHV